MKYTLKQWKEKIAGEIEFVDDRPLSAKLISYALRIIDKRFGEEEANKAIEEFGLEQFGWRKGG